MIEEENYYVHHSVHTKTEGVDNFMMGYHINLTCQLRDVLLLLQS
jgi:hypothetical protein